MIHRSPAESAPDRTGFSQRSSGHRPGSRSTQEGAHCMKTFPPIYQGSYRKRGTRALLLRSLVAVPESLANPGGQGGWCTALWFRGPPSEGGSDGRPNETTVGCCHPTSTGIRLVRRLLPRQLCLDQVSVCVG